MWSHNYYYRLIAFFICASVLVSCRQASDEKMVDEYNALSYSQHYSSLVQTERYARKALELSDGYASGKAEAYNNLAFVEIARMNYAQAKKILLQALAVTDNLVERMVSEVQLMRLCQRQSQNKEFYIHMQEASRFMQRIQMEKDALNDHLLARYAYVKSEYYIVASTYYYYVGLEDEGQRMLGYIKPEGEVVGDLPQTLNYYYNIGSGGILHGMPHEQICEQEFEYLIRCYMLAKQNKLPYWEANSLQAMSEHLQDKADLNLLLKICSQEIDYINADHMPDSLLAGNLATRAVNLFHEYGDVYQTAGAYRTLAQCYWNLSDYQSALICLSKALNTNKRVGEAPDLVASIREKLSLVYSAINDKQQSDYNRNIYLDLQENTRQDRQLEARAEQLDASVTQLNVMISCVCVLMLFIIFFLVWLYIKKHQRHYDRGTQSVLAHPLEQWAERQKDIERQRLELIDEEKEEINTTQQQLAEYKRINVEQRAKVSLVNDILPLINRIVVEVDHLREEPSDKESKLRKYEYIVELTTKIDEYNTALTHWIKMRQGELALHIESFPLQPLFEMVASGQTAFQMKGINFSVQPTNAVVKADKVLTLFMLNTLVGNARRFTSKGGRVTVKSETSENYVEISVEDTGKGMTDDEIRHLFMNRIIIDETLDRCDNVCAQHQQEQHQSHGFGLMNCKGIIEKYKKLSARFSMCMIGVDSAEGRGSRLFFRLPKGLSRRAGVLLVMMLAMFASPLYAQHSYTPKGRAQEYRVKANMYADSIYYSNVSAQYEKALMFADSCLQYINASFLALHPRQRDLMVMFGDNASNAAELSWAKKGIDIDYNVILDMRNECAVAALALHQWDTYQYNNKVYTRLFNVCSADHSLSAYVNAMQQTETNKNIAIVLLVFLLAALCSAYYLLYYRHRIYFSYAVEKMNEINTELLSTDTLQRKIERISQIWNALPKTQHSSRDVKHLGIMVHNILANLQKAVDKHQADGEQKILLDDELKSVQYEKDNMYVSNNILDNCLSTLKHETMYYPSRIKQLIDAPNKDMKIISELAHYYQTLYSVLSEQAARQIVKSTKIDYWLLEEVVNLLRKVCGQLEMQNPVNTPGKRYIQLTIRMVDYKVSRQQMADLFTPSTIDFRFLVCKQVLREFGEQTNARGCGIQAVMTENNDLQLEITVTKDIWKNSKLS